MLGSNTSLRVMTCLLAGTLSVASDARAQDDPGMDSAMSVFQMFDWVHGPGNGEMQPYAEITVPPGFAFTGADGTQQLLEMMQNIISGDELGLLMPEDSATEWFAVFEFDDVGYVPDDEKDELDADAMMESMKELEIESNKIRRERGWSEMHILGWGAKPNYNSETNNLEWATRLESDGSEFVNHNTKILGRHGVMIVTLVADQDELKYILPDFRRTLQGFTYLPGNRYSEFVEGDKIAEYGLTALVVGGAAAVAAKSGLFKWLWKILLIGGAAVASFFRKSFGRKKNNSSQPPPPVA